MMNYMALYLFSFFKKKKGQRIEEIKYFTIFHNLVSSAWKMHLTFTTFTSPACGVDIHLNYYTQCNEKYLSFHTGNYRLLYKLQ